MSPGSFEESVRVRRGDVGIHVSQWGAGPPLVLLHGLGTSSALWKHQIGPLGAHLRLVALDLRGFGRSSRPTAPGAYAIAEMAADVVAVLDQLGLERAHLLGASMGGFVAQVVATLHPARVDRLVLAQTSARMTIPRDIVESRIAVLRRDPMERYAELVAAQALAQPADPAVQRWLVGILARNDARAYEQVLVEGLGRFDWTDRCREIEAPALVVVGGRDLVIPPEGGRDLARRLPHAALVELPNVGHIGYAEDPSAFNASVLRFLQEVAA
ncbi:MAG: hypothetical protein DCC71_03330 [Proteobacteria bacterium]|nr:MAG: hypothetical protein DCC71_03330 [Pseudomonadota bacterium]